MIIGPELVETDPTEQKHRKKLRNLISFTMRSIVHRNKCINFSEINTGQILNWLTEKVKIDFKTQCTNRYVDMQCHL